MRTTNIKMLFNMGYLDGEEERRLQLNDSDTASLRNHLSNIMPYPEEYGVSAITMDSLNTDPMQFCNDNEDDGITYGMQMCFTIHHETPLSLATARPIIDAVYENGANASYTPDTEDAYPHTFLYPYHTIHDLSNEEETSDYEDIYTPCPPRRPTKYNCYNCSPAFATSDGMYPQEVDVCYTCERCGRTVSHSIDNPAVCKRCF